MSRFFEIDSRQSERGGTKRLRKISPGRDPNLKQLHLHSGRFVYVCHPKYNQDQYNVTLRVFNRALFLKRFVF